MCVGAPANLARFRLDRTGKSRQRIKLASNAASRCDLSKKETVMRLIKNKQETAATGYILLWLLGIPIPILFLIFLLRGCT